MKSSIPIRARYEYHIDNSKASFNYQERAKALEWDIEGTKMWDDFVSFGTITSFYYTVGNSKEGMDTLTSVNESLGLEVIEPFKGSFKITIDDYSEVFTFDYYVVDLSN